MRFLVPLLLVARLALADDSCTLRSLAARADLAVGASFVEGSHRPEFRAILGREFGSTTMPAYWSTTEPQPGVFNFAIADEAVAVADSLGLRLRGHPLVWGRLALPAWVTAITDPAELRARMTTHIETVVARYAGRIAQWDVVNEPLTFVGTPGTTDGLEDYVFHRLLGPGYIAEALAAAHAADPTAKLYVNELLALQPGPKQDRLFRLAQDLLAAGAPLHGIGFQGHVTPPFAPSYRPTRAEMIATFERFAGLGLEVEITELDVTLQPRSSCTVALQGETYRDVVAACLAVPACHGITVWGLGDGFTWIKDLFGVDGAPLPFDEAWQPKPAFLGLRAAVRDVACAGGNCSAACEALPSPERPAGCCVTAADCDDGDPCAVESCGTDAACVSQPVDGHAAVACVCARPAPTSCAVGIPDLVARRVAKACARIDRAADAEPGVARRHLIRAATQLGRAARIALRRIDDHACGEALASTLEDGQARARAAAH
ncbi:MAG TPA: endo-1,4-beta-xylanase [Candidatus Binatia bacterium]|jgi:endo-1,4-beta-xylanase|nr:endo-1,4-beta-xylanase [Candidatus Binatia bacterium]